MATLHYFAGFRGLSEPIRTFAAATDFNLHFDGVAMGDWEAKKPTTPFGQLPYLTLESGDNLAQSGAILTYIAESTGHNGADALERAKVRMIEGVLQDCASGWTFSDLEDAEKRGAARTKIESNWAKLNDQLGDGWAVGANFTAADARLWGEAERYTFLFDNFVVPPKIRAIADKFAALPGAQKHITGELQKQFLPAFMLEKVPYLKSRSDTL